MAYHCTVTIYITGLVRSCLVAYDGKRIFDYNISA